MRKLTPEWQNRCFSVKQEQIESRCKIFVQNVGSVTMAMPSRACPADNNSFPGDCHVYLDKTPAPDVGGIRGRVEVGCWKAKK
jgi:hypothetical protein